MTGYDYTKPRKPIAAMYNSPGPCYPLPTTTGQPGHDPQSKYVKRPGWFFGVKHGSLTQDSSPGPVHLPPQKYSRYGPDGEPHWSLYSRPADLKTDKPPGPGAYSPEHSGPSASFHAPAYGFGNRSKLRTQDNVPGMKNNRSETSETTHFSENYMTTNMLVVCTFSIMFIFSP